MREILFRGKRTDNGEWVYGYYCPVVRGKFPATPCIVPDCDGVWEGVPIIPETVGQYTGLKDKNGNKIFEGDIVVINTSEKRKIKKYRVEFDNGIFGIRLSTNANDNTIIPLRAFDYIEIIKGEEND